MASFTTSNVSTNLVGRELSIASTFVKQYYTLLNKAPCFIHNFYSHDSTFIHGTIEMANEHYTEPIVGREKIKRKMEDLKLNDCRAKIKQIDCLETLAGGLVIQVVGELSNNGRPMRRFLQTFVLAPSSYDTRSENEIKPGKVASADRRAPNLNNEPSNNSSNNQKFFVLNSIFRYQDDGIENDFDEDNVSSNTVCPSDSVKGAAEAHETEPPQRTISSNTIDAVVDAGAAVEFSQNKKRQSETNARSADEIKKLSNDLETGAKLSGRPNIDNEVRKESINAKIVSNGVGSVTDKKLETSDKTNENVSVKLASDQSQSSLNSTSQVATSQTAPPAVPRPSNEPKTWATMLRNSNPPLSSAQPTLGKSGSADQPQPQPQQTQSQQQHHQQTQQPSHQQPQQQQNINTTLSTPIHQSSQQQQTQLQQQNPQLVNSNSSNNINVNSNIRRRHMMRKPSNKTNGGGRSNMKNRPPRPPTMGRPLA